MNNEKQNMTNDIMENNPLVCVQCMTFNHEKYIEDALNGFVMQKTDFPFVVAVVDDASTDNNASVIVDYVAKYCDCKSNYTDEEKDYGRVIQAHPLTNPNCLLHIVLLKENHFRKKSKRPYYAEYEDAAKYIALCEGDDYWTDPDKLQIQVDFLESNPDYSMCFHAAKIKNETSTEILTTCDKIETKEYFTNDIFPGWVIPTASVLYRLDNVRQYPPLKHNEWIKFGDIVLFLICTSTGRVMGMEDKMSVYRMTDKGAVLSQRNESDYYEKMCRHYDCLMLNFPQLDNTWPNEYIATYYYSKYRNSKDLKTLLGCIKQVLTHKPSYLFYKWSKAFSMYIFRMLKK